MSHVSAAGLSSAASCSVTCRRQPATAGQKPACPILLFSSLLACKKEIIVAAGKGGRPASVRCLAIGWRLDVHGWYDREALVEIYSCKLNYGPASE